MEKLADCVNHAERTPNEGGAVSAITRYGDGRRSPSPNDPLVSADNSWATSTNGEQGASSFMVVLVEPSNIVCLYH